MNRRIFLHGLAALPLLTAFEARARVGLPTAGYLSGGTKDHPVNRLFHESIVAGLAEQGLVIPDKLRWLERYAGNIADRPTMVRALEALTRELVAEGAEVIITNGPSTNPAVSVAGAVPVVFGYSADPIAGGLADSLARPNRNTTGVTLMFVETNAKRLQMLKELAPSIRRIALISSPNHPGEAGEVEVCRRTVASLGVEMIYMPVYNAADLEKALAQAATAKVDALAALPDGVTIANRARLGEWALERRVPLTSGWAMFAESGALMTYGPSVSWSFQRVGYYAARALRGAKPADLPIEQPSRFEMVLNMKTAKALGIKIPQSILVRADRVIE